MAAWSRTTWTAKTWSRATFTEKTWSRATAASQQLFRPMSAFTDRNYDVGLDFIPRFSDAPGWSFSTDTRLTVRLRSLQSISDDTTVEGRP